MARPLHLYRAILPLSGEKFVFQCPSSKDTSASETQNWDMEQKFPQVKEDAAMCQGMQAAK